MSEPTQSDRRQFVRFVFFRLDPAWRRLDDRRRTADAAAFNAAVAQFAGHMLLRPYSLVGMRGDADLLLWQVADDLGVLRAFAAQINQTQLGQYLQQPYALLSMTRRSIYTIPEEPEDHATDRTIIVPSPAKYLFVYPFVKTRPWYALPKEERQAMMDEHIRVGRKYPNVKINTTYSYGLDDQEFVVAFETDAAAAFLDLVAELRETKASLYTLRDTPMFTCEQRPLPAILADLGAPMVGAASPRETPQHAHRAIRSGVAAWHTVARIADLPAGTSKLVYAEGEAIAIWNVVGHVYAIANRCTHARGNLCDGTLNGTNVRCPSHGGIFDLRTGAPVSGPVHLPLATYAVQVADDGTIAINLDLPGQAPGVTPDASEKGTTPMESTPTAAEATATTLDVIDRKLLNVLQWEFPLVDRPFTAIAERLNAQIVAEGLTEAAVNEGEVMRRVEELRQRTIVRQLSAIFDTRKLGYLSSLVAMRIASEHLDEAALIINEHPGVSHNYRRDNAFNLWFTLAVPPEEDLDAVLAALAERVGAEVVRKLPNLKMYKIAVKLDMEHDERTIDRKDAAPQYAKNPRALTPRDRALIRAVQNDLPTTADFFAEAAAQAGVTVPELFAWMAEMEQLGYLRRFAAILRHQEAGFTANGMITWRVPEDRVDEVGYKAAAYPQVSHCYRRPIYPDWPYNVFSMVHARSHAACEEIARQMSGDLQVDDYIILYSTHEYKKTRVEYFSSDWDAWSIKRGAGPAWADLDRRIAAGEFARGPRTWRERQAGAR